MKKLLKVALSGTVGVLIGVGLIFAVSRESATVAIEDGYGPKPTLPAPNATLIPTLNIAPASPWPPGTEPSPAEGLDVNEFAAGLDHPRWLLVLPNGDVLVAESNGPERPEYNKGIKAKVKSAAMSRAGAGCSPLRAMNGAI